MGQAIAVRTDYSSSEVRRLAQRAKYAGQARRLLAIGAVLDGSSREGAARLGGMDRNQDSRTPVNVRPSRFHPLATNLGCSVRRAHRTTDSYAAAGTLFAANRSWRRSTAQAIRASLLASATTTTFRWARLSSSLVQRPRGVSRSATWGSAARAP